MTEHILYMSICRFYYISLNVPLTLNLLAPTKVGARINP